MTVPPTLPRPPVDVRALSGRSVDLVRVDLGRHVSPLWSAIGDPELWSGTPTGPFATEAEFVAWLKERVETSGQALFAIVDKTRGAPEIVGLFFLLSILPAMGTAEIGLVYGTRLQKTMGGTEAVYLALQYLFETLGYRRVEWRCSTANEPSLRAARRYGFTREGVLRQHRWIKGANYDTAVHAILDREWPAIGARFVAWLAPANFTADGRQLAALSASSGS